MATIKSYTDLEQSRKLAEILPLESADGHWFNGYLGVNYRQEAKDFYDTTNNEYIPAWSLAALLGILPNDTSLLYFDNAYQMVYDKKPYVISNKFDNPIDSCVAMIEKLHELNLL